MHQPRQSENPSMQVLARRRADALDFRFVPLCSAATFQLYDAASVRTLTHQSRGTCAKQLAADFSSSIDGASEGEYRLAGGIARLFRFRFRVSGLWMHAGSQRPSLTDLDVSFCTLSCSTLQALLTRGLGLSSLNMSACINATDDLWPIGRGPREESADVLQLPGTSSGVRESGLKEATYALSTLSFVGCPSLYSLWLPATCAVYNNLHVRSPNQALGTASLRTCNAVL